MNQPLSSAVSIFFIVLYVMLFARIILSWLPINRNNKFLELLFALTEPVLAPVRTLVSRSPLGGPGMVLDFSPLIVFVLLRLAYRIIVPLLQSLGL
ncbi:MAG: YggT family protein [Defluviitaleaceae bacterium]|nr:YggT family protein [Defluviitaleaceae bacterium]